MSAKYNNGQPRSEGTSEVVSMSISEGHTYDVPAAKTGTFPDAETYTFPDVSERTFGGPSVRALLTPILEHLGRILWRKREHLTEHDRKWAMKKISDLFDTRLQK